MAKKPLTYAKIGGNRKTAGKRFSRAMVSTSRTADTCPADCVFRGAGIGHKPSEGGTSCYAAQKPGGGPDQFQLSAMKGTDTGRAMEILRVMAPPGSAVRHLVSGDIMHENDDYIEQANQLHAARPDLVGWGYTHNWRNLDPKSVKGWTLNASCETEPEARQAIRLGWQPIITSPKNEQLAKAKVNIEGKHVVTCPAEKKWVNPETGKTESRVGCADCPMCHMKGNIVEFPLHGTATSINAARIAIKRAGDPVSNTDQPDAVITNVDHFHHGAEGN